MEKMPQKNMLHMLNFLKFYLKEFLVVDYLHDLSSPFPISIQLANRLSNTIRANRQELINNHAFHAFASK